MTHICVAPILDENGEPVLDANGKPVFTSEEAEVWKACCDADLMKPLEQALAAGAGHAVRGAPVRSPVCCPSRADAGRAVRRAPVRSPVRWPPRADTGRAVRHAPVVRSPVRPFARSLRARRPTRRRPPTGPLATACGRDATGPKRRRPRRGQRRPLLPEPSSSQEPPQTAVIRSLFLNPS